MKVYILLGTTYGFDAMTEVLGVYTTEEAAKAEIPKFYVEEDECYEIDGDAAVLYVRPYEVL